MYVCIYIYIYIYIHIIVSYPWIHNQDFVAMALARGAGGDVYIWVDHVNNNTTTTNNNK